jgi:hypothetical protein
MQPSKCFEILVGSQGGGAGIAVIVDIAVIARNREKRKPRKPTPIWDDLG